MKKFGIGLLSLLLVVGISLSSSNTLDAKVAVKKYRNCKEMNKDYKGGVARSASVRNKGGKTKYKPFVSKELYDANKARDRDKDLIACER